MPASATHPNNHACISNAHPAVLPQCHMMNNNTKEKEEQEEGEDTEPKDDKVGEGFKKT